MSGRLAALVLGLGTAAASPATLALEVVDSALHVAYQHNGRSYDFEDHTIPLLPGNSCYRWYIQASEPNVQSTIVERLTLPAPIDWTPITSNPDSPTKIERDGLVAVTTMEMQADEQGWFWSGWCAAEGDPLGQHSIEVSADGQPVAAFHFEVVAPEDYAFPVTPLGPRDRSAHNNW